jgi:hypothetical protein
METNCGRCKKPGGTIAVDIGTGKPWQWWHQKCYNIASGV